MARPTAMPPGAPEGNSTSTSSVAELAGLGMVPADYVVRNRAAWDRWAVDFVTPARHAWTEEGLCWGLWSTPESELELVADLPERSDIVELGCGTAAISAWLARAGMRPVAVDVSRKQLDVAERLQREVGPSFPLIHANAEDVPYDTDSFDLAISDYGASLWCEPHRWLIEAHRLLRPGGRLLFVANSPLLMACTPDSGGRAGPMLVRDSFGTTVFELPDGVVEFHLSHSSWVTLLRAFGFTLERLVEVRPPHRAHARFELVSTEWARRWPSEDVWVARKAG